MSVAPVFQALADPTRLGLLDALARGPRSLSELAAPLDMSFQAVRKHLNVLEAVGLVSSMRRGKQRMCRLEPKELSKTARWLTSRTDVWNRRLDRLQQLTDEED